MLNKIVLMGRLTADIEVKATDSKKSVANFMLAVERDYMNSDGERDTDFINCTAWNGKASFLAKHFGKGDLVIVCGNLYVSQYEKNGEKRSAPFVSVTEIHFAVDKKNDSAAQQTTGADIPIFEEDGLPF